MGRAIGDTHTCTLTVRMLLAAPVTMETAFDTRARIERGSTSFNTPTPTRSRVLKTR